MNLKHLLLMMVFAVVLPFTAGADGVSLSPIATYPAVTDPAMFGLGAAETTAYDAVTQTLIITNGALGTLDIVSIENPADPVLLTELDLTPYGDGPTDTAVFNGTAGDLGPEDMAFISAEVSPNGLPLPAVSNEVSGTTTLYQITEMP
jgi:hypothetical protein